ncbi:MAG: signal peptide peptidase SppA [Pseudomonadota bacterium]
MSKPNPLARLLGATWRGVDSARRFTINVLFLAIVVGVLVLVFRDDTPVIEDGAALVIAPSGTLVEQLTAQGFEQFQEELMGNSINETLLKDVVDAIKAAKDDARVPMIVMDLNQFGGGRMTKLQDLAEAMDDFRASGKKIIAVADGYDMNSYYLAAHADEVLMHKMGAVIIEGMGRYRTYYKGGIDKFGFDINVFKVGTYKSAVEPYLLTGMSDAAREANEEWLGDIWRQYLEEVGEATGLGAETIDRYAQEFDTVLASVDGDMAQAALDLGMVDQLLTRVEMREYLVGLIGEDEESKSYRRTGMGEYLTALGGDRFGRETEGNTVAVVVARGTILDGSHPAGTIGGDSTAALIRKAHNDEDTKAIILRVDSGGGSAFASEVIRRELEAAQAKGLPVIASMGSVAASGGYWISTASDQIWAHPSTITGSIGIFAMIPTYQRPLEEYLGVRVDGIVTAPIAGLRPDRELPEQIGRAIQISIEEGYRGFLERVAESRDMTLEEVDAVAQGRVWSGEDAYELGLVDSLGDLNDAIAAAAELAELGEGSYTVRYIEKELDFQEQLIRDFMADSGLFDDLAVAEPSPLKTMLRDLEQSIETVTRFNDPNHVYAWSTIETD